MAHIGRVIRWELYWVDLEPHVGSEHGGERKPALVISNDGFNHHFELVTIVPLTKLEGKKRRVYPFEVLAPDLIGTGHLTIIMPQQVRTISRKRLLERIGVLTDEPVQVQVENRLMEHLGIEFAEDL